jgi:hypothetical protein
MIIRRVLFSWIGTLLGRTIWDQSYRTATTRRREEAIFSLQRTHEWAEGTHASITIRVAELLECFRRNQNSPLTRVDALAGPAIKY